MKKGSDHFKDTIEEFLHKTAGEDPLFAESFKKKHKNLNGCVDYIIQQVKKIGAVGYTDDEIFNLALHYYDEDDLGNVPAAGNFDCVTNHKPELTKEELAELKEKAKQEVILAEKQRLTSKKKKCAPALTPATDDKPKEREQLTLL